MSIPRVTEILKCFTGYEYVPTQILERAATRGTKVHVLCAAIANGVWVPDSMIDETHRGYVESFRKWMNESVSQFVVVEKRYTDKEEMFSGQVDFVVKGADNKFYLVDIKTSAKPQKSHPVQMAAYTNLLAQNCIPIEGAILVYLDKDGDYPKLNYLADMNEEWKVFLSALECYNYFNRGKKDERRKDCPNASGYSGQQEPAEPTPALARDHGGAQLHSEGRQDG